MHVGRTDLEAAAAQGIVTPEQARLLAEFLERRPQRGRFTGINVAYYAGALIVIGAMGWLMNRSWEVFGGWGLFALAAGYAVLFVMGSQQLPEVPSGLLVTMAVCMTPLGVYGLERATHLWPATDPGDYRDFWPYVRSSWCFMELATIVSGLIAVRLTKFPFLVAPVAVALWFMSMDIEGLVLDVPWGHHTREVSIAFGAAMLFASYLLDHRSRVDYAFWLYLFGMTALWGGLTTLADHGEMGKLAYCGLNFVFVALGVLLQRRVFVVYGAIGINLYLAHLCQEVFRDSIFFPFALSVLGVGIIAAAVQVQKNQLRIEGWVQSITPVWMRDLLPQSRLQQS